MASRLFKPLTLRALSSIVGWDLPQDRSLCVLWALHFYLDRTRDIRKGPQRLLIVYKPGYNGDIVVNTVSGWLKKMISLCYSLASPEDCQVTQVKAHDVRGLAAFWALFKNISVSAIMEACSWRSHNTFMSFYL